MVSGGKPHDVAGTSYTELREQAANVAADRAGAGGITIHTVTLENTKGVNFEFNEGLEIVLKVSGQSSRRDFSACPWRIFASV
ncbi:MAG TPA: hypothetical protein VGL77_01835 [Armatimonadota bacterium]